jgi:hypothetical protein
MSRSAPSAAGLLPVVLYGDHATRTGAPGAALTLGDLTLLVYHVPLVIYAPYSIARSGETNSLAEAFYQFSRRLLFHNAPSARVLYD